MSEDVKDTLQDYELQRIIGDGSNGVVYLAKDLKTGGLCAVKEFSLGQFSTQRFLKELSFLFTLQHPNIIRCQNLIYGGAKKSYLILEFAEHGNLRDHINQSGGKLPPSEVLNLARQIGAGLAQAHANDIIHCDVKPENILLGGDKDQLIYKLADLGIALHCHRNKSALSSGSPLYMAPEQFYDQPVPASDLYSLGVTLYECLTGKLLFDTNDSQELFLAHTQKFPDLESIECPQWRQVLSMLLAKRTADRPKSATGIGKLWDMIELKNRNSNISCTEISKNHLKTGARYRLITMPEPKATVPSPGVTYICSPDPYNSQEIWLSDGRWIDTYLIRESRLKRQSWIGNLTCMSSKKTTWLSFENRLCFWDLETRRITSLVDLRPKTLAIATSETMIATATSSIISLYSLHGHRLNEVDCANYVMEPHLLWKGDHLYVGSGPAQPSILKIDYLGSVEEKISLPGPLLCIYLNPLDHNISMIIQGANAEQPCALYSLDGDAQLKQIAELPTALYRCNDHREFLSLFDLHGRVHLIHPNGTIHGEMEIEGHSLADTWNPFVSTYSLLSKKEHSTNLHIFDLHSQLVPLNSPETELTPRNSNLCPPHLI